MWLSSLEIGAAQLRSVTEILLKSPFFICVNRSPTRWYSMNTWMYCAEITVLVCEQKPYPLWFLCWCKSYPVENWLWDMLAGEQALHFKPRENARARGDGSRFFHVPLKRDFSRVFQIRRACLQAGDMCESYLKLYLFVYLMSHTAKREKVALLGNQLEEAKLNKDIPHKLCAVGTRCTLFCPSR